MVNFKDVAVTKAKEMELYLKMDGSGVDAQQMLTMAQSLLEYLWMQVKQKELRDLWWTYIITELAER